MTNAPFRPTQRYVLTFSPKNGKPRVLKPSMTQKKKASLRRLRDSGDPAAIRTQDLLLRRQLLYPAELRGHHYFVGTPRFELGVSCSQSRRDNRTTLHPVDVHKKNASFWGAFLRRRGDSNPRYPNRVRQFSKLLVSATHPPLRSCMISVVTDPCLWKHRLRNRLQKYKHFFNQQNFFCLSSIDIRKTTYFCIDFKMFIS